MMMIHCVSVDVLFVLVGFLSSLQYVVSKILLTTYKYVCLHDDELINHFFTTLKQQVLASYYHFKIPSHSLPWTVF